MGNPTASMEICGGWLVCNISQALSPINSSLFFKINTGSGKGTPPDSFLPLSGT